MGRLVRDCELEICTQGLTKLLENNLAQSIQLLLDDNPSANVHFHERVSRQIIRLLDRALNVKMGTIPSFRFSNLQDFQQRLQNIIDLINPTVSKVGPILFGGPSAKAYSNKMMKYGSLALFTPLHPLKTMKTLLLVRLSST